MTRFVARTWLSALKIDGLPLIGRQARLPDMMTGPHKPWLPALSAQPPPKGFNQTDGQDCFNHFSSFNAKHPVTNHEAFFPSQPCDPGTPPIPIRRTTREPSLSCQPGCL
jgi:hypothetical protein